MPKAKLYDPGSLYDILRRVLPFWWAGFHTALLGMRFNEQPDIASESPTTKEPLKPSRKGRIFLIDLYRLEIPPEIAPNKKALAMKFIMSTLFPATLSCPEINVDLNLNFGRRSHEAVRIPCLWRSHQSTRTSSDSVLGCGQETSTVSAPILAFVDMPYISKRLITENPDHAPYIAAILLVMAQAHFYDTEIRTMSQFNLQDDHQFSHTSAPLFHDVKVQVITHHGHGDAGNFVVYTAIVTATFLTRFMLPRRASTRQDGNSGIEISCEKVRVYPLLGLRKRFAKALGSSTIGNLTLDDTDLLEESRPAPPNRDQQETRKGRKLR